MFSDDFFTGVLILLELLRYFSSVVCEKSSLELRAEEIWAMLKIPLLASLDYIFEIAFTLL